MLFLTMLTIDPARNQEAFQALRKLRPQAGVSIVARYGLFGGRDAVVIYDATSHENAMNFLTATLCKVRGVVDTETSSAINL